MRVLVPKHYEASHDNSQPWREHAPASIGCESSHSSARALRDLDTASLPEVLRHFIPLRG